VASRGALQLPLRRHPPPCPTTSTVICHASPIETLQGSAITPIGTANLSTISRRIKKLVQAQPATTASWQRKSGQGKGVQGWQ
jgi:hypothetical protein